MLIGNQSVLHKSPGRFLSGTVASGDRSNFSKPGMRVARFERLDKLSAGIPSGHLAPSSWALPRTGGGMSSRSACTISLAAAGTGAEGVNISGSTTFTIASAGTGQLIAGAVGSSTVTIGASGAITATVGAVGAAAFSIGATGTPGALGWLVGQSTVTVDGSMTSYAIGHMSGSTVDNSVLTADTVATAVWSKVLPL